MTTTTQPDWDIKSWDDMKKIFNSHETAKAEVARRVAAGEEKRRINFDEVRRSMLEQHLRDVGFVNVQGELNEELADQFIAHCLEDYEEWTNRSGRYIGLSFETEPYPLPDTYDYEKHSNCLEWVNERVREDMFNSDFICQEEHRDIDAECVPQEFGRYSLATRMDGTKYDRFYPNWDSYNQSTRQWVYASDLHGELLTDWWERHIDDIEDRCNPEYVPEDEEPEDRLVVKAELFADDYYLLWGLYLFAKHFDDYSSEKSMLYLIRWEMAKDYEDDINEFEDLFGLRERFPVLEKGRGIYPWHHGICEWAGESNEHCDVIPKYAEATNKLRKYALEGVCESYRDSGDTVMLDDYAVMRTDDKGATWNQVCPGDVKGICSTPKTFAEIDSIFDRVTKKEGLEAFNELIEAVDGLVGKEDDAE